MEPLTVSVAEMVWLPGVFSVAVKVPTPFTSVLLAGSTTAPVAGKLVRPMRAISESMTAFHRNPEDASRMIVPTARRDEVGQAQRALAAMQESLRASLAQKTRLAALGAAVAKINHDLRGILATARLASDQPG